jgi:hypothetical protein
MEPKVRVEQESVQPGATPDLWNIAWRVLNLGDALEILAVRAPHGKFRSDEVEYTPPVLVAPSRSGLVKLEVRCGEAPGAVVENAFLIMRVVWSGNSWLILARLRVCINGEGVPGMTTELITAQPVGFSLRETAG